MTKMQDAQNRLRETVKDLFAQQKVDLVVGFEAGSLPLRTRVCFLTSADEADRLVWNAFCTNNPAVYIPRLFQRPASPREEYKPPKLGIVAKACDARAVHKLLEEHQAPRENVTIIGMPCRGMACRDKVVIQAGDEVVEAVESTEGAVEIKTRGGASHRFELQDLLQQACLDCPQAAPEHVDVQIEGASRRDTTRRYEGLKNFEAMSADQRWEYFRHELSKCIRCYACRQVCPTCYCKTCFADMAKPRWTGAGDGLSDVMFYHIGRLMHQAGRCVECDACTRACPVGIDLKTFTRKLGKDVERLFDYVPGLRPDEAPLLCAFEDDDTEEFVTDG